MVQVYINYLPQALSEVELFKLSQALQRSLEVFEDDVQVLFRQSAFESASGYNFSCLIRVEGGSKQVESAVFSNLINQAITEVVTDSRCFEFLVLRVPDEVLK